MGDTKRPFYSLVIVGVINVGLNLLLVIGFKMSVAGVAIATVASNIVNAAIIICFLTHEKVFPAETEKTIRIETGIAENTANRSACRHTGHGILHFQCLCSGHD